MAFFCNDTFALQHVIQKSSACFFPKYKNILVAPLADNRKLIGGEINIIKVDADELADADPCAQKER